MSTDIFDDLVGSQSDEEAETETEAVSEETVEEEAVESVEEETVVEDGPAEEPAEPEVAQEADPVDPVRANRRETRRHTAHIPGPRRKPRFQAPEPVERPTTDEGDSAPAESTEETGPAGGQKYETPQTFGSVDR